ncbi:MULTISPECIES: hypothetical protein [Paraburkholderia]|jgi:hypothetical protein|nr:hypothetical protein [Paraburkholderia phenazinium]
MQSNIAVSPAISPAVPACARPVDRFDSSDVLYVPLKCGTRISMSQMSRLAKLLYVRIDFHFANLYIATQSANIARISVTVINGDFRRGYDAVQCY